MPAQAVRQLPDFRSGSRLILFPFPVGDGSSIANCPSCSRHALRQWSGLGRSALRACWWRARRERTELCAARIKRSRGRKSRGREPAPGKRECLLGGPHGMGNARKGDWAGKKVAQFWANETGKKQVTHTQFFGSLMVFFLFFSRSCRDELRPIAVLARLRGTVLPRTFRVAAKPAHFGPLFQGGWDLICINWRVFSP